MDVSVSFIQILDPSKLKLNETSKMQQGKNIEKSIQNIIPIKGTFIKKYNLIYGDNDDFQDKNAKKSVEFIGYLKESLK